jgi:hypothetical protein
MILTTYETRNLAGGRNRFTMKWSLKRPEHHGLENRLSRNLLALARSLYAY